MKKIILTLMLTIFVFGWETNTHRAIDQKAIEASTNLATFVADSGISENNYNKEEFEGYGYTYLKYIADGEPDSISKWTQTFDGIPSYQAMIEAGTMLEDAVWPGAWRGNGRFNNHFYEAQNGAQRSLS